MIAAFALLPAVASAATAKFGSRSLSAGMQGADVTTLQRDLSATGFATDASGSFTSATTSAVLAFQQRYALARDGVVGTSTFKKLFSVLRTANNLPDNVEPDATASAVETSVLSEGGVGLAPVTSTTGAADPTTGTTTYSTSGLTPTPSTTTTPTGAAAPIGATTPTGTGTTPAGTSTTPTGTSTTPAGTGTTPTGTETIPTGDSGGAAFVPPPVDSDVEPLSIDGNGLGDAPATAPMVIEDIVQGANTIAFTPYIYGGGHASFQSAGYDCSGSVSYALHAGGLLKTPMDSTQFESYGQPGPGRWITLWANAGHVYMEVAGVFYDTAAQTAADGDDRWSPTRISPTAGFVERHPTGW